MEHDVSGGLDQLIAVGYTNHCRFLHRRMLEQGAFNFNRADPHAFDFQHVVGPSHIPVITVSVAVIFVAGAQPLSAESLFRLLVLVPIAGAGGIAFDPEIADLAVGDWQVVLVDYAAFIAGEDLSALSWTGPAGTVRNEHGQ